MVQMKSFRDSDAWGDNLVRLCAGERKQVVRARAPPLDTPPSRWGAPLPSPPEGYVIQSSMGNGRNVSILS